MDSVCAHRLYHQLAQIDRLPRPYPSKHQLEAIVVKRIAPGRGIPGAPATARSSTSVKDSQPVAVRAVAVCMQSAAAARETRIDHEVHMGIFRLCPRTETLPRAVGAQKQTIGLCSRNRPTMLLTVMFSESPAIPGRSEHMPRTTSEIDTPACEPR